MFTDSLFFDVKNAFEKGRRIMPVVNGKNELLFISNTKRLL